MAAKQLRSKLVQVVGDRVEVPSSASLEWMFHGHRGAVALLSFLGEELSEASVLRDEELRLFSELEERGEVLEDPDELAQALACVDHAKTGDSIDALEREIEALEEQLEREESKLQTAVRHRDALARQAAELVDEGARHVEGRVADAVEEADATGARVDAALVEVADSCVAMERVLEARASPSNAFVVSGESVDDYVTADEQLSESLNEYFQSHFHGRPETLLVKGLSPAQHHAFAEELQRLQRAVEPTERRHLHAALELARIKAVHEFVRTMPADREPSSEAHQAVLRELEEQIEHLRSTEAEPLQRRLAEVEMSCVLLSDYDFKLARQQHVLDKQQCLLDALFRQQARHVLGRRVCQAQVERCTRLVSVLEALDDELSRAHGNVQLALHDVEVREDQEARLDVESRRAVDRSDVYRTRLFALLQHVNHEQALTEGDGVAIVSHEQMAELSARITQCLRETAAKRDALADTIEQVGEATRDTCGELRKHVASDENSTQELVQRTKDKLDSMTHEMEAALAEYQDKTREAARFPRDFEDEQHLFADFFLRPGTLTARLDDLARRVDARGV